VVDPGVDAAVDGEAVCGRGGGCVTADDTAVDAAALDEVVEDDDAGAGESPRARERRSSMRSRTSAHSLRASVRSFLSFTFR
jgi:hypothetical protein